MFGPLPLLPASRCFCCSACCLAVAFSLNRLRFLLLLLLQPAVFPPALREPPPPALELFDLDEHFASEAVRLAR